MYSHLVFTGGGMVGLSYLGVIRYLQEIGIDKEIREVSGTSIGALFAFLFAMHISEGELEEYFKDFLQKDGNISYPLQGLLSIMDTYGIDDGERFTKPLRHFAHTKYGWKSETMTFREFVKKTGINMIICATNLNTQKATYFSVNTTPDICVFEAIKASMCVPLLVKPVLIKDELYIDGGTCDNIPVVGFENIPSNKILIINAAATPIVKQGTVIDNFFIYLETILQVILNTANDIVKMKHLMSSYDVLLLDNAPISFLRLQTYDDSTIKAVISEEDLDAVIAYGYCKTYEFIKKKRTEKELIE